MLHDTINFIVNIIWDLWYIWIFIMMIIESSFFPFPSEIAMIPAWYLASIWDMNFIIALIIWTSWAIVWASLNYFLWKHFWWKIIKHMIHKFWKYIFLSEIHYIESERYFKKHWSITTFLWRFIPAIRQLISFPAWVFKMNIAKFLFFTWLWAWLWNLILMTIWYIAWENQDLLKTYSKEALLTILMIVIIVWLLYYLKNKNSN